MRNRMKGVTLIELVVVMVIVGVLASIAIPSYRQYVLRAHRAEAKTAMLNIAAGQEKFYTQCNRYTASLTGSLDGTCGTVSSPGTRGLGMSDGNAGVAGVQTENSWYTITVPTANIDTYTITATAIGSQAVDSDCASMTVDATGQKTATTTKCWH